MPQPSTATLSGSRNEKLLLGRAVTPSSTATPSRREEKRLLCTAVPPSTATPSLFEKERLLSRAVPPKSMATIPQLEELEGRESKCGTVPKSLSLRKLSGTLLMSGTLEKETGRKCTLSKSGNQKHLVNVPSSLSIQKSVGKKPKKFF